MLTRSGTALVLALGITAMVASMVVISATRSSQVVQSNAQRTYQLRCLAAVEAVLQRREAAVIALAQSGDLLTWTGEPGQPTNMGEDLVGGCRVRWKIEPMRTLIAAEAPNAPAALPYVTNPSPNVGLGANDGDEAPNTVTYLYQVSAEAVMLDRPQVAGGPPSTILARAQGARAISATNNPLFRYVINYAARGPRGDLELSHGPAFNVTGNVYSGGSIFIGANVAADDWLALGGPTGETTINPALPAPNQSRVWGLDGIYRMSKPLAVARLNNLTINNGVGNLGAITDIHYDLTTVRHPNEATAPNLTSFNAATNNGRNINPRRIRNAVGVVPASGGTVPARTINGVEVLSLGIDGNDSRDLERPATRAWSMTSFSNSGTTFSGQVQSLDTGATTELVDPQIAGAQALEAQLLGRVEVDGDPATDDHQFYRPTFVNADGSTTLTIPNGQPVEEPGVYMGFALGNGLAMRRLADNSGWQVVQRVGGALAPVQQAGSLIIRERLMPATVFWPGAGGDANAVVPANHPDYLPYAYGKHWRPTVMPATPIDVTENLMTTGNAAAWAGILTAGSNPTTQRTVNVPGRNIAYAGRGQFTMEGAARLPAPTTQNMTRTVGVSPGQSYERVHAFATDNWRMAHLKSRHGLTTAQINALPQGLRAYVWLGDDRSRRLLGVPSWSGLVAQLNGPIPWAPNAAGNPPPPTGLPADMDDFSVRWEGYLIPPILEAYTLGISHDDGVRIWVDDQLVYERWEYPNSAAIQNSTAISLSPQRPARIVVDFFERDGGQACALSWTYPGQAMTLIPTANLRAAPAVAGFNRTNFVGVTARIDLDQLRAGGPAGQKAGLMIREGHGTPNMVSGRDRFIALAVNPNRGIFLERRMQPSVIERPSSTILDYWVLNGYSTANGGSAVATINGNLGIPTDVTATVGGSNYVVNRTGRITLGDSEFQTIITQESVQNSTSAVSTVSSPAVAGTIQLNESTAISGFRYGAWRRYRTRTRVDREQHYRNGTFTYPFIGYTGVYPPPPYVAADRPLINFFSTAAPGTQTTTTVLQSWDNNTPYGVGAMTYGGINARALTRTVPGNSIYGENSAPKVTEAYTGDMSSRAIWVPTNGWPSGWTGGGVVTRLNQLGWNGASNWHLGSQTNNTSNRNGNAPGNPNPANSTFTLAELPDPVGALTNPVAPLPSGQQYSFSVPVTQTYTIDIDTNTRVGAGSVWGVADVAQTRPWLDVWETTFQLTAPQTRSFRPDLWWNALASPTPLTAIQNRSPNAPAGNFAPPNDDDELPSWAAWNSVWLNIQHNAATGALVLRYANGNDPVSPGNPWIVIPAQGGLSLGAAGGAATADVWSNSLLIGPAIQSGDAADAMTATFTDVRVQTTEAIGNNDDWWDATDWDSTPLPGVASAAARYMASQYQVFFANQDITQDFFSWADQPGIGGDPIATEDWFYNTREFWSQNRLWDNNVEKDVNAGAYSHAETTQRQLFAKSTMLIINQSRLWQYLQARTLAQATTAIMDNLPAPGAGMDPTLAAGFNGLVYAVRTNRYPFNPNPAQTNPWSASGNSLVLPNSSVATAYANLNTTDNVAHPGFLLNGIHRLQPYGLAVAPPLRPQQFHHGVMLTNGAALNWGNFTAPAGSINPPLGRGATSIVTPNQLYVVGDLNTTLVTVSRPNGPDAPRPVPMSIMGDSINFLSNNFSIANYKAPGFISNAANGTFGGGILGTPSGRPAISTTYNAAIVTYNQPSTLDRVREGQSAAVIDTMQFMENWSGAGVTMTYSGSLVVLGTRRYTEAFLCNVPKSNGRTPFGTIGPLAGGAPQWSGLSMQVYSAPIRVLNYNIDLLSPQGTPPFAPSGVTTASVGGWVRIIQ